MQTDQTSHSETTTTAIGADHPGEAEDSHGAKKELTPKPTAAPTTMEPSEEVPPPKPPRPLTPQQQAEATLREAFPSVEPAVVKAVLTASGGRVEPAFNALLGMSDPDALREPTPPPQPPRPARSPLASDQATSTSQNQLEADELYARQLAEHYSGTASYVPDLGRRNVTRDPPLPARRKETGLRPNELQDGDHSFLDDDLPVIKENIRKTFLETQSKVNRWVSDFKKKIDGDAADDFKEPPVQGYHAGVLERSYGNRRSGELARRSGDRDRYDADPRVLGDDFAGLELRDDEAPPRRTTRPLANPELFKPTPSIPSTAPRKVSFQDGAPEEIGIPPGSRPERKPSPAGKPSKWEPLSKVEPSPVADSDPFSLGDSDDERDTKSKDGKSEETMGSQKTAGEAPAGKSGREPKNEVAGHT